MDLLNSALRQLRARKATTALTLLLLAVGIGANTAIFSVVNSVLLEPLPYPESGDLVFVRKLYPEGGTPIPGGGDRTPDVEFAAWIDAVPKSFRALAGYLAGSAAFEVGDGATMVPIADASEGFFPMLGVRAWRGRLPGAEDCVPGATPVVVLSHAKWMSAFNGDDSAIGRVVKLNDIAHTVIGVLPPAFEFVDPADFWRPLPKAGLGRPGEFRIQLISVFGRVLPGADLVVAGLELEGISQRYWENPFGSLGAQVQPAAGPQPGPQPSGGAQPRRVVQHQAAENDGHTSAGPSGQREVREGAQAPAQPAPDPMRTIRSPFAQGKVRLAPLQEHLVNQSRATLWLLLGAVGLVLLIASANIASLQLARAEDRRREIAMRAALGASPGRLAAELFAENLLLALAGGLLGIVLAWWGVQVFEAWLATQLPRISSISIDGAVLAFAIALSVIAGLFFGTLPALRARRIDLLDALKEGGQQSTRTGHRLRQALVAAEVMLALVLAINTGLLARSVYQISSDDPGFRTEDVMTAGLSLPRRYADANQRRDFADRWLENLRAVPGVKTAALADMPPLSPYNQVMMIADFRATAGNTDASVTDAPRRMAVMTASTDYFRTLGIPLREGRLFTDGDTTGTPNVAIINEAFAKAHFPDGSAIGSTVDLPFGGHMETQERQGATIVGIVGDVRPGGLDARSQPIAYYPIGQHPRPRLTAIVRFEGSGSPIAQGMTQALHRVDPTLAVASPETLAGQIARQSAPRRVTLLLTGAFALTAVVLAALGIFGVMSYTVAQRTQEIGVRMALGADRAKILRLVLRFAAFAIGSGVVAGVLLTLATGRLLRSFMAGVESADPLVFFVAAALLAATGIAACLGPAVRATRVSPVEALREG